MARKTIQPSTTERLERAADDIIARKLNELESSLSKLLSSTLSSQWPDARGSDSEESNGRSASTSDLLGNRAISLLLRQLPSLLGGGSRKKMTSSSVETERSAVGRQRFSSSRAQQEAEWAATRMQSERYQ